ncbi:MAG: hypothetical protein QOC87_1398 [Actinomycetota bacterium]|nr:hypothetical protein [Actinomycetota bacterium]
MNTVGPACYRLQHPFQIVEVNRALAEGVVPGANPLELSDPESPGAAGAGVAYQERSVVSEGTMPGASAGGRTALRERYL